MQEGKVDGTTFDGTGSGTSKSPVGKINEGSIPTPYLGGLVVGYMDILKKNRPSILTKTIEGRITKKSINS